MCKVSNSPLRKVYPGEGGTARSRLLRAVLYYITIALLLIDPLYLSILCGLFGGGDMNGIALLLPEWAAGQENGRWWSAWISYRPDGTKPSASV